MTYEVPGDAIAAERLRHRYLSEISDPRTRRLLQDIGVASGWRCLEVGMGGGSVPVMLADMVGAEGQVLATDLDLRLKDEFLAEPPAQVEIRRHDLMKDPLPPAHFDLAHARATMEHLPDPDQGLRRLAAAVRPGGWVAVEGGDFSFFDLQPFPEPYGSLMRKVRELTRQGVNDHQDRFYVRGIQAMRDAGLEEIGFRGELWAMEGGQPSSEWFSLALEWGVADFVDKELLAAAIKQSREPDFLVMSPCHVSLWGRVPE